jgi:hypothetical protein
MAIYAQPIMSTRDLNKFKLSAQPEHNDLIVWNQQTQSFDPVSSNDIIKGINSGYKVKRYFFSNF